MRPKLFVITTILLLCGQAFSQPYTASLSVKNLPNQKVLLGSFFGERISILDSARTNAEGTVTFSFPAGRPSGIYRFIVDKQRYTDFVFNKEHVILSVDYAKELKGVEVIASKENKDYYDFIDHDRLLIKKLDALETFGSEYPVGDQLYEKAGKEYEKSQEERQAMINAFAAAGKNSYVARVIAMQYKPSLKWGWKDEQKRTFIIDHYFDGLDFTDTSLIRTNIYPSRIIEYLTLYTRPGLSQHDLEQEFVRGIDKAVPYFNLNPHVYEFLLAYLAGGFEKYKMEEVLNHLYERYIAELNCADDKISKDLTTRLQAYQKMAVGKTAPEFILATLDGKQVGSADMTKNYTLLLFWATWCPHCKETLPKIRDLFKSSPVPGLQLITVSLDTNKTEWVSFIREYEKDWINTCDFKGWNGKVVQDYNIYATPTMFLIDRQRKIIAKPVGYYDLIQALVEKNLMKY